MQQCINYLNYRLQETYESIRREVMYILTEFVVSMKLVKLIKMHIKETYSKVHKGKLLYIHSIS